MSDEVAVNTLNDLLVAESKSLLHRLGEASPFASLANAGDLLVLNELLDHMRQHERDLTELILCLRGAPEPPHHNSRTGSLHYVNLSHLVFDLISCLKELVATYGAAAGTGNERADELIARNLDDYQTHLAELEKAHANLMAQ